jgi:hypothetical protein
VHEFANASREGPRQTRTSTGFDVSLQNGQYACSVLPDGWTIKRVMAVAQGPAELVSMDVEAIVDAIEPGATELTVVGTSPLAPRCIIRFVDLYLVQDSDGYW